MRRIKGRTRYYVDALARIPHVWSRDIELAAKAAVENKRAVLLGSGSVLYVQEQERRQ